MTELTNKHDQLWLLNGIIILGLPVVWGMELNQII